MRRTRFAPSPTGFLHLGNARTALFSWLWAQQAQEEGRFILRLEDSDLLRSQERFASSIKEDLLWLGLGWTDPVLRQSQRMPIYEDYFSRLGKHAYPCFCTEEELQAHRRLQASRSLAPRYSGACRKLDDKARQERLASGIPHTWRFAIPAGKTLAFADRVFGEMRFSSDDLGDFVIRRQDGTFTFFFANALDDALTQVTDVIRGEDHLANTPRQMLLLEAWGFPIPAYAHLPLVLDDMGEPLSKRKGAATVAGLRQEGFLPLAIANALARLGWHLAEERLFSLPELAARFSWDKVGRSPARLTRDHLLHWQKHAVAEMQAEQAKRWASEAFALVPEEKKGLFWQAICPNILFPQDALFWARRLFGQEPLEIAHDAKEALRGKEDFLESARAEALKAPSGFDAFCQSLFRACPLGKKEAFHTLRAALTGALKGPELRLVFSLLGQEEVAKRLEEAKKR